MSTDSWAVNASLVATSALALAANALLILVFFRRRGLRTVSNRFVINLLITNLLSSLILIPLLLADQELKEDTPDLQDIIFRDLNSSSHLNIENVRLKNFEINTTEGTFEEDDEDFELEILNVKDSTTDEKHNLKIRHFRHFVKINNDSEATVVNTSQVIEEVIDNDKAEFLCYVAEGSTSLVCTASILSILLIAIDQYFAVTHPLRYHTFIDKLRSWKLLITTWVISAVFGIAGSFIRTDSNLWNFCTRSTVAVVRSKSDFQIGFNIIYSFTYLVLVIVVPFLVICVIYGCIYCAAHRNSERMRKSNSGSSSTNLDLYVQIPLDEHRYKVKVNSSDNLTVESEVLPTLPKVKSAPNFANLEKTRLNSLPNIIENTIPITPKVSHANSLRSNSSFITSLKSKISNASLFRYREETRAAKISILVIFMVLICYMPYGLALVLNTLLIDQPLGHLNMLSLSLLVVANLFSPFLFAYRNRRIQRELRRLFGFLPSRVPKELRVNRDRKTSVYQPKELKQYSTTNESVLTHAIPEVVVTCKQEVEKKSILKRVCSKGKNWGNTKKCNFIPVDSCLSAECRCSFSSASTQVSSEDYTACI